jgi:chorismate synthase
MGPCIRPPNYSGGIQGGISNGEAIVIRVAFKPTATIRKEQQTINAAGEATTLSAKGRHDPCVLPRAVPMVEAMVSLVLADHLLRQQGAMQPLVISTSPSFWPETGSHCC